MQSNSNITKFNKAQRFSFDEVQDRTTKGRKLNKQRRGNDKRNQWDSFNDEE